MIIVFFFSYVIEKAGIRIMRNKVMHLEQNSDLKIAFAQ